MTLEEIIKEKFGSVDKLIETTGTQISRSYLYQIISGNKANLTIDMAKELTNILGLESIEKLVEIINANKKI